VKCGGVREVVGMLGVGMFTLFFVLCLSGVVQDTLNRTASMHKCTKN